MNSKFSLLALVTAAIFLSSCQTTPIWKDDDQPSGTDSWDSIEYKSEAAIHGLFATDFELYVASENSFARLNSNLDIIEKRLFPISNAITALSDNSFVRLATNSQNRQVVEFHLARNGSEVHRILVDTLPVPAGNSLEIETLANSIGAFSYDGTLFLMAAKVLPARHYSLFLFSIQQNPSHDSFVSVKMVKRIDLTNLDANADGVIKSMRFHNGNFYVATQQGAWRITPAGAATQSFSQWKEDSFIWQGDLYMTGTVDFDLDKSTDNGLTWKREDFGSELRQVVVADTSIFTQIVTGKAFQLMPKDFRKAKDIVYPPGTNTASSFFYGLVYFNGRYYFSIDKSIFATDLVPTE